MLSIFGGFRFSLSATWTPRRSQRIAGRWTMTTERQHISSLFYLRSCFRHCNGIERKSERRYFDFKDSIAQARELPTRVFSKKNLTCDDALFAIFLDMRRVELWKAFLPWTRAFKFYRWRVLNSHFFALQENSIKQ